MALTDITTVEELHTYLYAALQLEHATLPPYLTALYSIKPGTNSDAYHVIRVVAVEEMLHLTLAANILNATGGKPNLTQPGFVPAYPAYLPDGESDFQVDLQPFSQAAVTTFLKIERPSEEDRVIHRERRSGGALLASSPKQSDLHFYSIGQFYEEIERGIEYLHAQQSKGGEQLFVGDPSRQITPEYYYSGGGGVIPVTDLESAKAAINLVAEQGEGLTHRVFDEDGEIAHYYRFQQLQKGSYYRQGDKADNPTGPPVDVDFAAVYPVKANPRLADYPEGSELHAAAVEFNESYADLLSLITRAYNGEREVLIEAVVGMFRLRDKMNALIRNPIPGMDGVNAGPTFELTPVPSQVES